MVINVLLSQYVVSRISAFHANLLTPTLPKTPEARVLVSIQMFHIGK